MDVKKDILWRVYLTFFVMVAFAAVVISQTVNLQFFQAKKIKADVVVKVAEYRTVEANRGDIYSSDGSLMATSMTFYLVGMDCSSKAMTEENFQENIGALSDSLSALLGGKTPNEFRRELEHSRKTKKHWYKLHDALTYSQFVRMKKFPLFNKGKYEGGLVYTRSIKRKRPYEMLAYRTIGNMDVKPIGIEGAYDFELKGEDGWQYQRKIGEGVWVPMDDASSIEPVDGGDIYTTIDMNIQDIAETELLKNMRKYEADHGCIVVMEVSTGKIKGIANLRQDSTGRYWEDVNYAVGSAVEPGSVFKLASYMVGFEDGKYTVNTKVETAPGVYMVYDLKASDLDHGPYGLIDVKRAFELSSNVGVVKLTQENYGSNPQNFVNRLYKFGLTEPLGIRIEGEGKPVIRYPGDAGWSGVSLASMSYGYGIKVTPLQLLSFYNAVANNGKKMKPLFVERIVDKNGNVKTFPIEVLNHAMCSKETVRQAKIMLEAVVENGTAKGIKSDKYKIAGKTGTAKYGYTRNKAEKSHYNSSFIGYFPADNPKYSMVVMITDPKKGYYASEVAAPVFKAVSDRIFATMIDTAKLKKTSAAPLIAEKLKPSSPEDEHVLSKKMAVKNVPNQKKIVTPALGDTKVPDVTGMGLKDGVFLLENMGLIVKVQGRGVIRKQSILPGTQIIKGQEIIIELI
ncbi:MAG: penicillin-binding protein [Bacteroidetes bacterium]|nr:penicillin-binding protein [Bacteroidota bacterium]